jgi:hypothetical protein
LSRELSVLVGQLILPSFRQVFSHGFVDGDDPPSVARSSGRDRRGADPTVDPRGADLEFPCQFCDEVFILAQRPRILSRLGQCGLESIPPHDHGHARFAEGISASSSVALSLQLFGNLGG